MDAPYNIRATLGALLAGGVVCTGLSGIVSMQAYLYLRFYQKDFLALKMLVLVIWVLDTFHTAMVGTANWSYLIESFGNPNIHDVIFWSLGVSVGVTAFVIFCSHCFFVHRLYRLSKGNLYFTAPIGFLAVCRLASALVTTSEMVRLAQFSLFFKDFRWVFTLGLCLSALVDVMIAGGMCFYLKRQRTGCSDMDTIIDAVILYTVENGILTCIATIASLVCWLVMPHNLVYLGLHFMISKLYANSLLASLNARKTLRQVHSSIVEGSVRPGFRASLQPGSPGPFSAFSMRSEKKMTNTKLEISVQRTIDCVTIDEEMRYTPSPSPSPSFVADRDEHKHSEYA